MKTVGVTAKKYEEILLSSSERRLGSKHALILLAHNVYHVMIFHQHVQFFDFHNNQKKIVQSMPPVLPYLVLSPPLQDTGHGPNSPHGDQTPMSGHTPQLHRTFSVELPGHASVSANASNRTTTNQLGDIN